MILSFCLYFIRILGQIHLWGHDMSALFYYEGLLLIFSAKSCIRRHPHALLTRFTPTATKNHNTSSSTIVPPGFTPIQ